MEKLNLELKKYGIQFVCTNCNFAPSTIKEKKRVQKFLFTKKTVKSKKIKKKKTLYAKNLQNLKSIFIDNEFPSNNLYRHNKFQIEEDLKREKISRETEKIILRTPIKIRSSQNRKTTATKLNNNFMSFDQFHHVEEHSFSRMDIDDLFKTKNSLVNDIFGNSKNISPIYTKIKKSILDENDENLKSLSQNDLSFF